ncbi:hypothetical protein BGZ49_000370 [Haplosporangium sp. Z 27]|nr:hypothetical protein BGZ49_000370 [Haplosporangium sp. Z 27]
MAITNGTSLQETNELQLAQSADSLESALAQFSKLAASIEKCTPAPIQPNAGRGFDEWIASDLQYGALLGGDETTLSTSPYSASTESPLLEIELLNSNVMPSLFEISNAQHAFSYEPQALSAQDPGVDYINQIASLGLSTSRLQRAAAALNIPWSPELERSVIIQTQKLSGSTSGTKNSFEQPNAEVTNIKNVSKRSHSPEEEESEEILAKRAKNTDAARRSRLKKLVKLETLETKVADLEVTNHRLNTRVAVLETEKNGHLIKEAEQNARIAQLEAKIMEAHLTLKTRLA